MKNSNTEVKITKKTAKLLFCLLKDYIRQNKKDSYDCEESFLALYQLAKIHGLAPILYDIIQGENCIQTRYPKHWEQLKHSYMFTIARSVQQEMGMQEIQETFHSHQLPIVFFKGAQIREFYPVTELRTMGDMDALITQKDRERAHELMLNLGYLCEQSESDVWVYRRGVIMVEMHTRIAGNGISNHFDYAGLFADAMDHCVEEDGTRYFEPEYHFCFLIYHIAKHLSSTGAGIRMFLDIVIFLHHYGRGFQWDKAEQLLKEAALEGTAAAVFGLCDRWFGTKLTRENRIDQNVLDELEDYVIHGGTFGFETHDTGDVYRRKAHADNSQRQGLGYRLRLWRDYLFPPSDYMMRFLPATKKHRWLIPVAWIRRWWVGAFQRRRHSMETIRSMNKEDGDRSYREYRMLKRIGL